ncbi:MAG: rhodanese-like domain-containing protein [Gemmatimonadetes bacterium]|nr:rhodanese-like domain-containing protein [Gemmatimonadota bacterium]
MSGWRNASAATRLAVAAGILGVLAPFAGSPYLSAHARVDVDELSRIVQREEDHVAPLELARWIKDRREGLRVVDLRSDSEFVEYHLPTAERVPVDSLAHASFRRGDVIVLYSEGGGHAAQGWVFLRAIGYPHVYVLRDGLYGWLDDVMNASVPENATPAQRAAFEQAAELSRYFGGQPSGGPPRLPGSAVPALPKGGAAPGESGNAAVKRLKKRSC